MSDWDTGLARLHLLLATPHARTILACLHHSRSYPEDTAAEVNQGAASDAVRLLVDLDLVRLAPPPGGGVPEALVLTCRGRRFMALLPDGPVPPGG